jgi:hypothetical protein
MSKTPTDDVVRLARAANPQEAHIWRQALEDEGIAATVDGDYLSASIGNLPPTLPEVWVHEKDLARAREILLAHAHPHLDDDPDESEEEA